MQGAVFGLAVLSASVALGEARTVNHYSVERLHAESGVTNVVSSVRFAAQADGIVKTGAGAVVLGTGDLTSSEPVQVTVHEGSVVLSPSSSSEKSVEPPSVIRNKASLWLQAGVNAVAPTDGSSGVEYWYDVRESAEKALPTGGEGVYPMARTIGVYNEAEKKTILQCPEVQQIVTPTGTRDMMYFHGDSYSWMRFYAANHQNETSLKCFHTFAVVFPKDTWRYLYGTMGNVPLFSEPAGLSAYFSYAGTLNVASARFYVDGELMDGSSAVRRELQVQELEFDHRHATWECLFRNSTNGRYGGDWVGEVIAFSRHLSAEERLAVSEYLIAKWIGQPSTPCVKLKVAAGGAVVTGIDGTTSLSGEGDVIHTGSGQMAVQPAKGAEASVTYAQKGAGSVRAEVDVMRVRPIAGEKVTVATDSYDGQVLTTEGSGADDVFALAGSGSVRLEGIPAGTRVISASTRELVLGAQRQSGRSVQTGDIYATIINGDAEQRFEDNPAAVSEDRFASGGVPASGVLDSWHYETIGGFSILNVQNDLGLWKFALNAEDDRDRFAAVQGKGCVTFKQQTTAWTEMSVPADGDYEFSYFATSRRGYDAGFLCVSILAHDGSAVVHDICRHPILLAEGWRPYRYLVRGVKAGSYRLQLTLDCSGGDRSAHVDDIRMRLVAPADDAALRCAVPNGGFNLTTGAIGDAGTFCKDNLPVGWTLTQGPVGSLVTTARDAMNLDVALATRWHRPAQNNVAPAGSYYNPSGCFGEAQLNFRSNAGQADSAEFTVPAGLWRVRVNAGKWTFRGGADVVGDGQYDYLSTKWNKLYGNPDLNPTCGASVFVNGVETNLGSTPGISSYAMADYTVANAFAVSAGDRVKIRLRQDTAPNASGPAMLAVNEVWLERADNPNNLVQNASFEEGVATDPYYTVTGWTLEKHKDLSASSNAHRYNPYNPTVQGSTRCTGDWALLLVDAGSAKQDVVFQKAGCYRLSFKARARFMDIDGVVDNVRYGGNRVRAWLQDAAGKALPIFQTGDVYSTNFVEHASTFTVPAPGTYTLNLNGCNLHPSAPTGRTSNDQRVVYIDDVEVIPLAEDDVVAPDIDRHVNLELASGTRLRLDFVGTNAVRSFKIGNRVFSGLIDANHRSGLVSGPGALSAGSNGFVIVIQ